MHLYQSCNCRESLVFLVVLLQHFIVLRTNVQQGHGFRGSVKYLVAAVERSTANNTTIKQTKEVHTNISKRRGAVFFTQH